MPVRSVIFDLDQTIASTAPILYSSWNAAMAAVGREPWTPEQIQSLFGPPEWKALQQMVGERLYAVAFDAYMRHYHAHFSQVRVYPGVRELLAELRARRVHLSLLTGKGRATAEVTLVLLGVRDLFDLVLTGDELPRPKPAPDGIHLALAHAAATPAEALMVGDMVSDVEAARAAGARSAAALWDCEWPERLRGARPDLCFETVQALRDYLMSERKLAD